MKKTLFFLLFLSSSIAMANDIEGTIAIIRGVDKVTGHTATSKIHVGHPTKFNNLKITVGRCLKTPPEETPENAAYILIEEEKDQAYQVVFNGWMFSSNPALSAMEHPIFDIWLLSCEAAESKNQEPIMNTTGGNETIPLPVQQEIEDERIATPLLTANENIPETDQISSTEISKTQPDNTEEIIED